MANLQIKNLPPEVHEELRRRAGAEGTTVRDYVVRLLKFDQAFPPRHRWLDEVLTRPRIDPGRPAAELIEDDRAGRDAELAARSHRR